MARPMRTLLSAMLLAIAMLGAVAPGRASAESILWSLVASPLAVSTGVTTNFALVATNEDPLALLDSDAEIGCVVVDVPANFRIAGASVTGASTGNSWSASISGNRVKVRAGSGGDRLELLDSVSFTIRATALSAGSLTWGARAYRAQDCSGTGALLGVPPVVVVSGTTVTPTPSASPASTPQTPTPTPTPSPSPMPSPTPTPLLPLPTTLLPLPSAPTLLPSASPQLPGSPAQSSPPPEPAIGGSLPSAPPASPAITGQPTGSAASTPSPTPGATAPSDEPGAEPGGGALPPNDGGTGVGSADIALPLPRLGFEEAQEFLDVGVGGIGVLTGIDVWAVPAVAIGVPGLLIVLWVALQTAGAVAWIPAVRRLRGEDARAS